MPELRWTLLLLGILFLAGLAWWELRRARRNRPPEVERHSHSPDFSRETLRPAAHPREPAPVFHDTQHREPILSREPLEERGAGAAREPASREALRHREPTLTLPEMRSRETPRELPVVEIGEDDSLIGLRIDGQRIEEELTVEEGAPIAQDLEQEPSLPEPANPPSPVTAAIPSEPLTPQEPIVDWPDDDQRRIVALRLAAAANERFAGRALRQALSAEGFVLGKFSIFHKAAPDGRVVVSATSLTQPGSFDLDLMDTQRFSGLSLFSVLPGPLSALEAFECLLETTRNLNTRLQGMLQTERGEPLTPVAIARMRDSLSIEPEPGLHNDNELSHATPHAHEEPHSRSDFTSSAREPEPPA